VRRRNGGHATNIDPRDDEGRDARGLR
jgi:hypothetical protein